MQGCTGEADTSLHALYLAEEVQLNRKSVFESIPSIDVSLNCVHQH